MATWRVDGNNEPHLRFNRSNGIPAIDIAIRADGNPVIRILGRDGKERIGLDLGGADKPELVMSDDRWAGRAHLGYFEPDTVNPASNTWGFAFRAVGSERTVAGIGISKTADGEISGNVIVQGKSIR